MAKQTQKKKNYRLRRQIRRTLGTICLITALIVAAVPVPGARAEGDTTVTAVKYTWDKLIGETGKSVIPVIAKDCNTIYTTGDGTYQFAFVRESDTSPNMIAVILGYNGGTLDNNYLEIPDTVEAYTKFNENLGTKTGYVAVSRSQMPLYYMSTPAVYEKDVSGNDTDVLISEPEYSPCYYADYSKWSHLDLDDFFYLDNANGEFVKTESELDQWIKELEVKYIGNQSLTANLAADTSANGAVQEWVIAEGTKASDKVINTLPENGIFANQKNIKTMVVGKNLVGIGNYAFYGCSNLQTIELGNGLAEIGKYAFAECINMSSIGIDITSNLQYISDYTFLNCRAMTSFMLPSGVTTIYDHAFDGCTRLGDAERGGILDIAGLEENVNVNLEKLGYSVFRGCTGLDEIILPESISSAANIVNLNNFEECTSLKHIVAQSANTTFGDEGSTEFTIADFKNTVDPTFYFEASGTSATHNFTQDNAIAFKYADKDCYEIIIIEEAVGGGDAKLTYQVNSNNELLYFNMTDEVEEVDIPVAIGPYGISAINSGSFSGNCFLKKITIPATVSRINDGAFMGCHNLEHVIFSNAEAIIHIGEDAFATQVVDLHASACSNKDFLTTNLSPKLTFTGTAKKGIVPFDYAMNPSNGINAGAQTKSYITYYSGWPTNLEIQYVLNEETGTGAATLVDYPTYGELNLGSKYTEGNYPYITEEYEEAAEEAVQKYNDWLSNSATEVTANQWDIINSALKLNVPEGVDAFATGLFSGVTGKEDADGNYTVTAVAGQSADTMIQEITFADVDVYEPYSFDGCKSLKQINIVGGDAEIRDYAFAASDDYDNTNLTTISMLAGGSTIGDYAFCNNAELTSVALSPAVSEIGLRPFKDCPKLEYVNFQGSPYFTTENAIIYGLENGTKDTIVQCFESRGKLSTPGSVSATELAGVTTIANEAFMDCEEIGSVDLSTSLVSAIPEKAFCNTESLYSIVLPTTCKSISKNAFADSNIRYADIPSSVTYIDPFAFNTGSNLNSEGSYYTIEFYCEAGSAAETYANEYDNIKVTDKPISTTFKVIFWDHDGSIIDEQNVPLGSDAEAPDDPVREGYRFTGWLPNFTNISKDTDVTAQYEKIDSSEETFTVQFIDYDDTILYTQKVAPGEDAITPQDPKRDGYVFTGWRPAITDITKDTDTYAQYEKADGTNVGTGGNGSVSGGDVSGGNGTTGSTTLYTLNVVNGAGSGSYVAGAQAVISATPSSGMLFDYWMVTPSDAALTSKELSPAVITMPAGDVTVVAYYKVDPNANNGSSSNGNSNAPGSSVTSSGTTVVIDKNGLSNTGVVSATVNGSSDNFTIKITEDSAAAEAAVKALMAEYGDISNIKYFPMDISLYDSTGKKKITDTTGLSISITLPLPDSMITYAGNNKVASVVNGKLDKLSPKFTTISGVSCVTFTAEHFSPYLIYVDTGNLTAGTVDTTPKTGDGIHPKWFLSIGLACLAFVLFMQKDKKQVPAKARVRA